MSAITVPTEIAAETAGDTSGVGRLDALRALTGRRLSLSLRNPRAILLPLATPLLIALVIAPALAKLAGPVSGIDYLTYLAIGTAGLVIPLSAMQAGLGVIVDRNSGSQPDLLAAPIPRPFLVLANLLAALVASGLQLATLVTFSIIRGATFHASAAGLAWFAGAAVALGVATYGIAETMANRIGEEEEYVNAIPTIGIAPWFFAGSLFSIQSLPSWLTFVAKLLPVTHAVALMRYGACLHAADLHAIWGLTDPTVMATLSLGVLVLYAAGFMYLAVRVFTGKTDR
jgi:ABC-type multidrug transport system permease subunit